jgi:predicted alpha/beta-hydrolase family hydrolase
MREAWSVGFLFVGLLALALAASDPGHGEEPKASGDVVTIATPRGAKLEANLHRPEKPNGAAVVLAPGQGYHRARPLFVRSAEALAEAGIVALRFDWAYTPSKGQPSADYSAEREDLEAALAHVRGLPGVERVVLAGKSLGSLVAFQRALERAEDLAGLALLTFPIHEPGGRPRPGVERFGEQAVPTLVVQGDRDPLGMLPALYDLATNSRNPPRVVVVPGDHGYEEKPDEARGVENLDVAVRSLVLWAKRFAAR